MFGLFSSVYCDEEGNPVEELLSVAKDREKLELLVELSHEEYLETKKKSDEFQIQFRKDFSEFVKINEKFWNNNIQAIKNCYHPEGLWVKTEYVGGWKPQFSGVSPHSNIYDFCPNSYNKVISPYSDEEKLNQQKSFAKYLSQLRYYSYIKYIDWDKITDPIPVFVADYDPDNPPKISGAEKSNLFIKEIKEI